MDVSEIMCIGVTGNKPTHMEPMSEMVRQFFFSQERNGFHKTSSVVTNLSWYLLHSIFSKQKSLNRAAINLYDNFFPFDHKQYLPQFVWYKLAYSGETVQLFFPSGFSKFQLATWPVNPSQKPV